MSDRKKLLETLETTNISEEGTIGPISLNREKLKRWRKEIDGAKLPRVDESPRYGRGN